MNRTLIVASMWHCEAILTSEYGNSMYTHLPFDPIRSHPMWQQTGVGCKILQILQDMYKFNVSYIQRNHLWKKIVAEENISYIYEDTIDIYVRPISLRSELLDHFYPLQAVSTKRLGFLLRKHNRVDFFDKFYSKPFTRPAWNCLYGLAVIFALIFYYLKLWEKRLVGCREVSFSYEALMVIGGYCQHIPPLEATLPSRRTAYLVFFAFAYLVYTFYTSNLLSHLVNDKNHIFDLKGLAESEYECIIADYMKQAIEESISAYPSNYSVMVKKLIDMPSVSVPDGMEAVKAGRAAILSDYVTLYPYIKSSFENDEICTLVKIDLFSKIIKYFFSSKQFPFKEHFKIGALRVKEAGILKHLLALKADMPLCFETQFIKAGLQQISVPLIVLFCSYVLSVLILVAERIHYKRNKVWPYIE